jgi:hypothetical protein
MTKILARAALLGAVAFATPACDNFAQAVTSHTDVLARAAGHELTVEQAAALVAPHERIPAQPNVVDAVANLWVDYTLLATAVSRDSTLRNVNVDLFLRGPMQQQMVNKLRDDVIKVDSVISDEELRAEWEREQPGLEVRARHILMRVPTEATPAQRDSVTALMRQIRERAVKGEDFAALAREHSQDGSAQQGGDLGFFGKDSQMAPPFRDAALALQPGQISDIVTTVFGLHLIKVEERKNPSFDEMKDAFRAQTVQRRVAKAEEDYIKGLTDPLEIEVQEGAVQNAKEMANRPATSLRGRAASRALVRYEGGSLSANELLSEMRRWEPGVRGQMATAPDDQVKQVLEQMARNEILVEEAERKGHEMSEAEMDTARLQVQQQLATAARMVGLTDIQPQDGETMHQAIERKVNAYLTAIMTNEQQIIPLGVIGFALREQFGGEVFDRAVDSVVVKIAQTRPPAPPPAPPQPTPPPADTGTRR